MNTNKPEDQQAEQTDPPDQPDDQLPPQTSQTCGAVGAVKENNTPTDNGAQNEEQLAVASKPSDPSVQHPQETPHSTETQQTVAENAVPASLKSKLLAFVKSPPMMMVTSVFLFSLMVLFVKLASRYYTSFEIISFRGFVGAICLLVYQQLAHGHGLSFMKTSHFGMHMWRSFIGCMSMICWFYGIAHLTLSLSNTISYMSSIWMALFIIASSMMTGQGKPDPKLIFTILIGFTGIVVIMRPSDNDLNMWACFIVLLSSIFTALAYLQVAALGRIGEPTQRTVFYFCMFGAIFGLLCAALNPKGFSPFSWAGIGWMLPIGILAMLAQLFLTTAYTKGNALVNASLQYLGLVFVIVFDWILGEQWPDKLTWLGMILVVLSGLLATILRSKRLPGLVKHAQKHHIKD